MRLLESALLESPPCIAHRRLVIIVVNACWGSHIVTILVMLLSHCHTWVPVVVLTFRCAASLWSDTLILLMRICLVRWLTLIHWLLVLYLKLCFKSIYDLVVLVIVVISSLWHENICSVRMFFLVSELPLFSQLLVKLRVIHLLLLISRASRSCSRLDTLCLR